MEQTEIQIKFSEYLLTVCELSVCLSCWYRAREMETNKVAKSYSMAVMIKLWLPFTEDFPVAWKSFNQVISQTSSQVYDINLTIKTSFLGFHVYWGQRPLKQ